MFLTSCFRKKTHRKLGSGGIWPFWNNHLLTSHLSLASSHPLTSPPRTRMEAYAPQKIRVFQGKSGKWGKITDCSKPFTAKLRDIVAPSRPQRVSFFNLRIARFFKVDLEALGQIILADLKLRFKSTLHYSNLHFQYKIHLQSW